jgi:uncharacterized protein (TIGR02145 family)
MIMRITVLFSLFLFVQNSVFAQLKEFEITPLPKPEISLVQANTEFGEDALIIIYSSLTNLNFRSSMGMIDKQSYNPQSNRYEILVRPIKQILLVYSNGFMEGTISTINPNSKDVFYFKVEEKKTAISPPTAPGKLTINSTPTGANISLNGIPVATKTPFTGELNPGPTRIKLSKTKYQTFDTIMNVQSSINEVLTINLKPSTLWLNITSNPSGAQVMLDGVNIGITPLSKELDLSYNSKQGSRSLKLTLSEYADQSQIIQVYPSKDPLKVDVDFKKIEGQFSIESIPSGADVFIDAIYYGQAPLKGALPLGKYSVELKMEGFIPSTKEDIIINSKTTANLKKNLILNKEQLENIEADFVDGELLIDASGNSYKSVKIGNQVWMAENLKTDRYSNGDLIPNIKGNFEWSNLKAGAWTSYNNSSQNDEIYGKLYNWYAVSDKRNVCPDRWHVPTDKEWTILTNYLGGEAVAGEKMKSTGETIWKKSSYESSTNESGFSGLPGGYRDFNGPWLDIGGYGYWWSSSEHDAGFGWSCILNYGSGNAIKYSFNKRGGFSVRCLMD